MIDWHSSFSTGSFEIDTQHLSLDLTLQFMITCDPSRRLETLGRFYDAVEGHIALEEKLMVGDKPFVDEEHRQDHRRMDGDLADKIEEMRAYEDDDYSFREGAFYLSQTLVNHIFNFDIKKSPPKRPT
jgi:hemerythrin-like metal-binding protein